MHRGPLHSSRYINGHGLTSISCKQANNFGYRNSGIEKLARLKKN